MYLKEGNVDPTKFFQGDIVDSFPFLIITPEINLLERTGTLDTFAVNRIGVLPEEGTEFLAAFPVRIHRVIILSQTCDIQNNQTLMIAPVYSLSEVTADGRLTPNNVNLVSKRRGAMKDWFYLPPLDEKLEASFVDFQTIHYIPKDMMANYLGQRVASLSDWGIHSLGWALSDFLARPIEDKYR